MFQFLNNSTKQNSPLQKKTTIFSMIPSEKRPVQKKVQPQFTMIAGCGADHQPLQMLSKKCVSQNSFQMLSTNTMIQTKKKRKKNKRRQKAIAYQDRLEQRLHDKLIGSSLRQILDVKNPLHNPAYKSSSIATLADMEPEDRVAWTKSLQASVHSVLDDYVPVPLPTDSHGAYNALTTFNGVKKEMQVRYDPDVVTYRNRDVRIGRLTATFTHEIAVHGLDGNPDEEHHQMASPADRDKYLEAVHNAFNSLDNTRQKTAFVNEWRQDMFNQIAWDDTIHNPEKRQRRRWVQAQYDEMIAAIESPQRYRWAI